MYNNTKSMYISSYIHLESFSFEVTYYGGSNKSQADFHPGRFLFQAARKIIEVPWPQDNNDRSGILNPFIDQENLQMYAQMDGILFCQ